MRLTVAGDTPTSAAICLPVSRWRRKISMIAHVEGAVWLGNERGLEERSRKPSLIVCAEPFDPLGDRLRRGVELERGGGFAQSSFHTLHHGLSTFRRQGSILMAVHLVSPWNTEASQPQLLGSDQLDNLLKAHI
jgi:hypothetical protein